MKNTLSQERVFSVVMTLLSGFLLPLLVAAQPPPDKRRMTVEISTDLGTVVVELFNETPLHRDNFVSLVKEGFYDSLLFHRVIPGFMVQAGDSASKLAGGDELLGESPDGPTLPAEIVPGLIHKRGALAAAREPDDVNPERRSSAHQFYIVHGRSYQTADLERLEERSARFGDPHTYTEPEKDVYTKLGGAPHLDGSYTVFGQVIGGMDVINAIALMPTDANDRPLKDLRIYMRLK